MIKILIIIINIAVIFRGVAFATQMVETAKTLVEKNNDATAAANTDTNINANANKNTSANTKPAKKGNNSKKSYKSIMFSDKNIADITKSMPLPGATKQDYSNKSIGSESIDDSKTLVDDNNVDIYLNSIMFISKNNWTIWLNGNKITNLDNGEGDIVVTSVSPLRASFYWKVGLSRWEIVNANKNIPNSKYKIEANDVKLFFSLSPNQTYIPSTNKVIEGRIKREQIEENIDKKAEEIDNEQVINKNDSIFF